MNGKRHVLDDEHDRPRRRGIDGNEKADTAAKEATGWRQVSSRRDRKREVMTNDTAPRTAHQRRIIPMRRELIGSVSSEHSLFKKLGK